MKSVGRTDGFTIIEVLLFLAISAALLVALMGTVGFTISRQRFTDSITSSQAFVQTQYSETLNTENGRGDGNCSAASGTTTTSAGTTPRGASNCVVLGRALYFDGSPTVTAYAVVGTEPALTATPHAGVDLLKDYKPGVDTSSPETFGVPWDATVTSVRRQGGGKVGKLFLLRAPDSGLALALGGSSVSDALNQGTGGFNICIKSADITSDVSMVSLSSVAGSEGVTTTSDLTGDQQAASC